MLKKLSLVILTLLSLAGCNDKKAKSGEPVDPPKKTATSAFEYNENFVNKESSLALDISTTESKVSIYKAAEQWDSIAVAGERMERLIGATIKEIKDNPAPDVKEGQNFKDAGLRYFEFMKNMYTVYKDYGHETTDAGRAKQLEKLSSLNEQKRIEIENIQSAQKKLADANNFKIGNKY